VDLVVEVVGGGGLADSINSLRYGGRIGLVGILDKEDKPIAPTKPLLFGGKTSEWKPLHVFLLNTNALLQSRVPWVEAVDR
jgi:NADPH:quinone reductase-like Zn-dependent oxidoreductase